MNFLLSLVAVSALALAAVLAAQVEGPCNMALVLVTRVLFQVFEDFRLAGQPAGGALGLGRALLWQDIRLSTRHEARKASVGGRHPAAFVFVALL